MKVEIDKKKHFAICAVIAGITAVLLVLVGGNVWSCMIGGFATAMSAGATKEWCDKLYGNYIDWHDILADACGAILGCLLGLFALI